MSYYECDINNIPRSHGRTSAALPQNIRIYKTPEIKAAVIVSTRQQGDLAEHPGSSCVVSVLHGTKCGVPLSFQPGNDRFLN